MTDQVGVTYCLPHGDIAGVGNSACDYAVANLACMVAVGDCDLRPLLVEPAVTPLRPAIAKAIAALDAEHYQDDPPTGGFDCVVCYHTSGWPCVTRQVADDLRAAVGEEGDDKPCKVCNGQGCEQGCGTCDFADAGPDSHKVCRGCHGAGREAGDE